MQKEDPGHSLEFPISYVVDEENSTIEEGGHQKKRSKKQKVAVFLKIQLIAKWAPVMRKEMMMRWQATCNRLKRRNIRDRQNSSEVGFNPEQRWLVANFREKPSLYL